MFLLRRKISQAHLSSSPSSLTLPPKAGKTFVAVAEATATTCVAKATRVALATHIRSCSFSYSKYGFLFAYIFSLRQAETKYICSLLSDVECHERQAFIPFYCFLNRPAGPRPQASNSWGMLGRAFRRKASPSIPTAELYIRARDGREVESFGVAKGLHLYCNTSGQWSGGGAITK